MVEIAPGDGLGGSSLPLPASRLSKKGDFYTHLATRIGLTEVLCRCATVDIAPEITWVKPSCPAPLVVSGGSAKCIDI